MDNDNKVCILGMGYVGLTLAAAMSERGFIVCGVEIDQQKLISIQNGSSHFHEVGLDNALRRGISSGTLEFVAKIPPDNNFDVFVITVGTPLDNQHKPRMDMVKNVANEISCNMGNGALVILRSTVKLGTSRHIVEAELAKSGNSFDLAFCPERTLEGKALEELAYLPQIIGGLTEAATERAMNLFRRLTATIVRVSGLESAELVKLLDNSYRDLFFGFGNEVALLCEAIGANGREVINAANMGYERTNIAKPGFVGGPCLEKDPYILIESLKSYNFTPKLVECGRRINEALIDHIFIRAMEELQWPNRPVVTLLGLAFKGQPATDDTRGSPALEMVAKFKGKVPGAIVRGHDYMLNKSDIEDLGLVPVDDEQAFQGANIVILMNNNQRYSWLDIESRAASMDQPGLVYDCWGVFPKTISMPRGVKLSVF